MVQVSKRGWQLGLLFIFLVAVFHITSIQNRYMRDDEEIAFRTTSHDLSYTVWYQATLKMYMPLFGFLHFGCGSSLSVTLNSWGVFTAYSLLW